MKSTYTTLATVAVCALASLTPLAASASNHAATAGSNMPYEFWSTNKVKVVNPDKVNVPTIRPNTDVRVETRSGTEQTLKLSNPIGKI